MTTINIPLDPDVVKKANDKLEPYGITVEQAVGKIVNAIADGENATEYLELPRVVAALAEVADGKTEDFSSVEDMMAYLHADD